MLQDTLVFTINRELCAERYASLPIPGEVTNNMICAGLLNVGGRDSCDGDAGGPVFLGNIIIGIVSWGQRCGDADFPGVATSVSSFTNWILATTANN